MTPASPRPGLIRGMPMIARKIAHLPPGHPMPTAAWDWLRTRVEHAIATLGEQNRTAKQTTPGEGEPHRG